MKTSPKIIVVVLALAAVALGVVGLMLAQRPHPWALARELAAVAPPPQEPGVVPPASSPRPPPAPSAPGQRPLNEKRFIEVSSSVLIGVAAIQDRPDAKDLIPPLMEKVLQEEGVSTEQFQAMAEQIYGDPERSRRVAQAILDRVEQRATPQMRARVTDLAEAMRQMQAGKHSKAAEPMPPPR